MLAHQDLKRRQNCASIFGSVWLRMIFFLKLFVLLVLLSYGQFWEDGKRVNFLSRCKTFWLVRDNIICSKHCQLRLKRSPKPSVTWFHHLHSHTWPSLSKIELSSIWNAFAVISPLYNSTWWKSWITVIVSGGGNPPGKNFLNGWQVNHWVTVSSVETFPRTYCIFIKISKINMTSISYLAYWRWNFLNGV